MPDTRTRVKRKFRCRPTNLREQAGKSLLRWGLRASWIWRDLNCASSEKALFDRSGKREVNKSRAIFSKSIIL